jgi:hypoxanthine phosphoribosyltransferase
MSGVRMMLPGAPPRIDPRIGDVYLTEEEIRSRVEELGVAVSRDYAGRDLLLVTVLKGAFIFAADLARAITIPHAMDFLALSGYGGPLGGHSGIRIIKDIDSPVTGRDVLLLQNVIDTGLTLNYLLKVLRLRRPADVAVCTLLDRPYRRLVDDLPIGYVGFTVPDEFFAGYGFDLAERFRGLRDLRVVRP